MDGKVIIMDNRVDQYLDYIAGKFDRTRMWCVPEKLPQEIRYSREGLYYTPLNSCWAVSSFDGECKNYLYTHNRRTHVSDIRNPGNNSGITWNEAGEITVESSNASEEEGSSSVSVLTEATIDIFTCKPVGSPSNGVRSGSEYLRVPHISKATVDALRGNGSGNETVVKSVQDSEADGQDTRQLDGLNGTYTVPFMESPASKRRTSKTNKRIIIGTT